MRTVIGLCMDPSRLPRRAKRIIMLTADLIMIPLALWSAIALRLGTPFPTVSPIWWLFLAAPALSIPVFIRLGLYRAVVRFMGSQAVFAVLKGVTLSALLLATLTLLSGLKGLPRSAFVIYWGVALLYIGGSRFLIRAYFQTLTRRGEIGEAVAIYGAGASGAQLALALNNSREFVPVAFLDDNKALQGSVIHGVRVYDPKGLPELIGELGITQVLLAMPSVSRARRRVIINYLEPLPVHVRTIPGVEALVSGSAGFDEIREVGIEDLLGRDAVLPDHNLLDACIHRKVVMVTGAGGSIGSELCRQIVRLGPTRVVLFEISEFALYRIERDLRTLMKRENLDVDLVSLLGSVQDRNRVETSMRTFSVQTVYHAAAYKHVPLVEHNPIEGVQNNVFGTWQAAEAAISANVRDFVLISTDKAVRPTNVMGASKRFSELVLQGLAQRECATRFCMVRFGNVLGSSGSVVPLFREQIRHGGPVTVTHPEIIRYFMTIPEASQLVIQAGSMAEGGDVFVLDMGEPVRIYDLARKMIHLSGYEVKDDENPNGDIAIEFTGLRPGEKLYEELLIGDNVEGTQHAMIMRAEEDSLPYEKVRKLLRDIEVACEKMDTEAMRKVLVEAVHGYTYKDEIEDYVWKELQGANISKKGRADHEERAIAEKSILH